MLLKCKIFIRYVVEAEVFGSLGDIRMLDM